LNFVSDVILATLDWRE